jgi:hypothetical protein
MQMSLKDIGPKMKKGGTLFIQYRRGKIIPCPIVLAANNLNSPACLSDCTVMAAALGACSWLCPTGAMTEAFSVFNIVQSRRLVIL